jgi:hypothetical protein
MGRSKSPKNGTTRQKIKNIPSPGTHITKKIVQQLQ